MKSLIEELKNNFNITQLCFKEQGNNFKTITTELFDTHNKAVDALINKLKELGYKDITLPYQPTPYVLQRDSEEYFGFVAIIQTQSCIERCKNAKKIREITN